MRKTILTSLLLLVVLAATFSGGSIGCKVWDAKSEVVTALSPQDGATAVSVDSAVTATFSDAIIEPADWSTAFTLQKDGVGGSLCLSVSYDSSTRTATCSHATLLRDSAYAISVAGLRDAVERVMYGADAVFYTGNVPTVGLKIVRLDGEKLDLSASPIPLRVAVEASFDTPMNRESVEAAMSVTDGSGTALAGTFSWDSYDTVATFTMSQSLEYHSTYQVRIADTASSKGAMSAVDEPFTTLMSRDVNGDGYDDVVAGSYAVTGGASKGAAYLFLGSPNGVSDCDLSAGCLANTTFTGAANADDLGISVGTAGDVNGDGYIDVIVGAMFAGGGRGKAYVFHGSANGIPDCDLSSLDTCAPNATIIGPTGQTIGYSVNYAGDVNADGYDDVIVSGTALGGDKGRAFVFLGSAAGIGDRDLSSGGLADATLTGTGATTMFGVSSSTAGDVNADGFDDVIVGESSWSVDRGRAYVFLGGSGGVSDCDLSVPDSCTPNAIIEGENSGYLGYSVSNAGDLDADGFDDVAAGAWGYDSGKGRAYVFKGSADGVGDCNLSGACGNLISTITGESAGDSFGYSLSSAGDVDGDGSEDLLFGAYGALNMKGSAYLFLGAQLFAEMNAADAAARFTGNYEGASLGGAAQVSSAGDINGDGYGDILVGAENSPDAGQKGQDYIFLGGVYGPSSCDLSASCAANTTITGAANGNLLGRVH